MIEKSFLLDLFTEIRADGSWISPGLEEYFMVLSLIKSGKYPIQNFSDLAFLLETSWLKSYEKREKFRDLLERRRTEILNFADYIQELNNKEQSFMNLDPPMEDDALKADENVQLKKNINKNQNKVDPEYPDFQPGASNQPIQDDDNSDDYNEHVEGKRVGTSNENLVSFIIPNYLRLRHSPAAERIVVSEVYNTPFIFTNDYFPVKNRQLQQLWRTLKNKIEGNNSMEVNFEGTISKIAQKGYFTGFSFQRYFNNRFQLFILLDDCEAMVGVSDFGTELIHTAKESQMHQEFKPWFFSELPTYNDGINDYLLYNKDRTRKRSIRQLFSGLVAKNILVVIYSEGGAFLGKKDEVQIKQMNKFLNFLKRHCGQSVWLNPAPRERWNGSSAGVYARQIPMFDTSRRDLDRSASTLRGKFLK